MGSRSETTIDTRPLLATPREAARALSVSRETIYRMCAAGELQTVRVRGSIRIPLSALQRFCQNDDEPRTAGMNASALGSDSLEARNGSSLGRGSLVDDPAERDGTSNSGAVEPTRLAGTNDE